MQVQLLKCKLHRAAVTGADVAYEGSLTISRDLAARAGMHEYERILVGNLSNGERFETYVIFGEDGNGTIELNGATAFRGKVGDRLTIMCFASIPESDAPNHRPKVVVLDEHNKVVSDQGR